ncbi:MAG: S9 family peptidase [Dokdonella sp.]
MKTWLIAGLLLCGAVHAADPAPVKPVGPISVNDFVRTAAAADMRISPTGKFLALTVPDADDRNFLVIINRVDMKIVGSLKAREGDIIDEFAWVNDERVVASIASKVGGVDRPIPTGELYGINADGSKSGILFSYRAQAENKGTHIKQRDARRASATLIDTLRDDDKRVLVTVADWDSKSSTVESKPEYGLLDVYSGRFVSTGTIPLTRAQLVADNTGTARLAYANDNEQFRQVLVRGKGSSDWTMFDDARKSNAPMTPLRFAPDNKHFYATIAASSGPNGLYKVNIETGEKELVYRGKADPLALIETRDQNDAFGVITADGRTDNHVFDESAVDSRLLLALEASFKDQWVHLLNFTVDGKLALIRVGSDRNPGDIYLFDTEKKTADYVSSPRTWLEPELMSAVRPISFKARDGLEINGYLTLPRGAGEKNLPMVLLTHGGPYGIRDTWDFDTETQLLASRGYAVLRVNFRGSGGYGDAFMKAGYREWGGKMQDDLSDGTRWAIKQGFADPKRICAYGASYGAYASLMAVAREPSLYQCAIGYIGVYDLRLMRSRGDIGRSFYGEGYLDMVLGDDDTDLWARSPTSMASRIKAKVMLISGGEDRRAPSAHSEGLRSALTKNGAEVDWLYKANEGHGFYKQENKIELYERMLAFLDANIGSKGDGSSGAKTTP